MLSRCHYHPDDLLSSLFVGPLEDREGGKVYLATATAGHPAYLELKSPALVERGLVM